MSNLFFFIFILYFKHLQIFKHIIQIDKIYKNNNVCFVRFVSLKKKRKIFLFILQKKTSSLNFLNVTQLSNNSKHSFKI